jgi:hypothetical protein
MPVTGDWSRNFASAANLDPFVDPDLAMIYGHLVIEGGTLKSPPAGEGMAKLLGQTYGNIVKVKFAWSASAGYDRIGAALMDPATTEINYAGYMLTFSGGYPELWRSDNAQYPNHPESTRLAVYPTIVGIAEGDECELELNRTTRAFTFRHKGMIQQTTGGLDSVIDSTISNLVFPRWR